MFLRIKKAMEKSCFGTNKHIHPHSLTLDYKRDIFCIDPLVYSGLRDPNRYPKCIVGMYVAKAKLR